MNAVEKFTSQFINLSDESLQALSDIFTKKNYKKGEVIYNIGIVHKKTYIITDGIARSYVLDKNGGEHIRSFFSPVSTICSMSSLTNKTPCISGYDCITDCTLYEACWDNFISLVEKYHDISLLYGKIFEDAFIRIESRITSLSVLDATERYLQLKEVAPNIENQIPLYQIAAYLNITPIQFSRIRKKLYSK